MNEEEELSTELKEKLTFEKDKEVFEEELDEEEYTRHISNFCCVYLDFDSYSDEYMGFLEFNLNDHGYYILKNLYKGIEVVQEEMDYIVGLTSNK